MSGRKRTKNVSSGPIKKRKTITLELKLNILNRFAAGEKAIDISRHLNLPPTTVRTIIKQEKNIRDHAKAGTSKSAKIFAKFRTPTMEKMETLLIDWIKDANQKNIPLSTAIIQTKAKSIFVTLAELSKEETNTFQASRGWFENFKNRNEFLNIKLSGESASADTAAADAFLQTFKNIVADGGYSSRQIFNVDETALYWKKMPSRTYLATAEKHASGFKAAKDRLTLLLGGNAAGDFKLKPLLIYHSENPRALKGITKTSLPVVWRSNRKAWVTASLFTDWYKVYFCPAVKDYCIKNNLAHKALLVLDNAPGHPVSLDELDENIKVIFLPPNTTSILQPMDQGVIATFKAYYLRRTLQEMIHEIDRRSEENEATVKDYWKNFTIRHAVFNIGKSWDEVSSTTMSGSWKKLWSENHSTICSEDAAEVQTEILNMAKAIGFTEVDLSDVDNLLTQQDSPLSDDELIELREHHEDSEAQTEDNDNPQNILSLKKLATIISSSDDLKNLIEEIDPDSERRCLAIEAITKGVTCYKDLYIETKKAGLSQPTLKKYFQPVTATSPQSSNSSSDDTISSSDEFEGLLD